MSMNLSRTYKWKIAVIGIFVLVVLFDPNAFAAEKSCQDQVVAASALNHATYMGEILTAIKTLSVDRDNKGKNYLMSILRNELDLGKSLLILMETKSEKGPIVLKFEETKAGILLQELLGKEISNEQLASMLPKDLREKFGDEGIVLFNSMYKVSQYLNTLSRTSNFKRERK